MFSDKLTLTTEQRNGQLYDIPFPKTIDGSLFDVSALKSKVLIITNTASKCGLTDGHYKELEALYQEFKPKGLEIIGMPCGQFAGQEHGDVCKIKDRANQYKITFPLTEKIDVNGSQQHPVIQYLKAHEPTFISGDKVSRIGWNFGKFLVNRDGTVAKYYGPRTNPSAMRTDIIQALS